MNWDMMKKASEIFDQKFMLMGNHEKYDFVIIDFHNIPPGSE